MGVRFGIVAIVAAACLISPAHGQDDPYPAHSVRLVVSSLPGGNPDVLGRLLADRMTGDFGKAVIVENVTGAGGAMSAATVAKAAADGYTLLFGDTGIMGINPLIKPDIGFDPVKDFAPVTALVALPTILVADPKVPAFRNAGARLLALREARWWGARSLPSPRPSGAATAGLFPG